MTVAELVEKLTALPQDAEILLDIEWTYRPVWRVELNNPPPFQQGHGHPMVIIS